MNTYDYDNTHSRWLDVIARSKQDWNGFVIANVMYSDKKARNVKVYDTYYWVTIEKYEELANAPSQGSIYWNKWSVYGTPETRYTNQDKGLSGDNTGLIGEEYKKDELQDRIDGKVLREAIKERDEGTFDKWVEDNYEDDQESIDKIEQWLDKYDNGLELFERTEEIRKLIKAEQLTTKKAIKTFMLDIQEYFGVSINKKFMFDQLSSVSGGKFNPNQFVRYKAKMKQIYTAMEKEGLEGVGTVGERILRTNGTRIFNAKNPLIRSRGAYKGKEAVKSLIQGKNWLEGEDAVKAIEIYHRKVLKEQAQGFQKRNRMNLIVKKTRQGKTIARWSRNVSKGRKLITISKKALRIAKWFI